jgi:iron-sulfur cluster repair protein YtfE (RIC family)
MANINFEITLYHSPYHDNLIEELCSIMKQKKSLYRKIKSESEFNSKLSYDERELLKHLSAKEDKILFELIAHKGWDKQLLENEFLERDNLFQDNQRDENEFSSHFFGY